MKRRAVLLLVSSFAVSAFVPIAAHAGNTSGTFQLVMEADNFGLAANGDQVVVTGGGTFSLHPKSVSASGDFTHLDPTGTIVGAGTWTATQLLSVNFYGCRFIPALGVDLGDDNLCGGAVKMRVNLDTPAGEFRGILTVFCVVGPKAPASHNEPAEEGVTLDVPGVINFNHAIHGENIYIRTS